MNLIQPALSRQAAEAVQNMPIKLRYEFIEALQTAKKESDLSPEFQNYLAGGYKPAKVTKSLEEALADVQLEWIEE
jgi:hypothetical protein